MAFGRFLVDLDRRGKLKRMEPTEQIRFERAIMEAQGAKPTKLLVSKKFLKKLKKELGPMADDSEKFKVLVGLPVEMNETLTDGKFVMEAT